MPAGEWLRVAGIWAEGFLLGQVEKQEVDRVDEVDVVDVGVSGVRTGLGGKMAGVLAVAEAVG